MQVETHKGCWVYAGRWQDFLHEWRAASPENRVVLPDKRPAVRRPPSESDPRPSYVTVHAKAWEEIKPKLAMRMRLMAHPKRGRLCAACGATMKVTQELEEVWSFSCPVCKSVENWGKNLVGGQMGAGEREKT
jgi:hypothetical protein